MNNETIIQNEIIKYLHSNHVPVWRISETKNLIGFPDLLSIDPKTGQFIGIEVKTPTGVVSSVQEVVHKIIENAKGVIIVARKVEDVKKFFDKP